VDQNLIVVSGSEEIRHSFLESYTLLGYEVTVSEDIVEVIRGLNDLDPDQVVMDVDGMPRQWKVAASGLRLAQKKITVVLLASAMTADQANEAALLGVSGVIIKPFLPELHLKRVYDIIHQELRNAGLRIYPRYYAGGVFEGSLEYHSEATSKQHLFELVNVSETGFAVRTRDLGAAPELQARSLIDNAILRIDNQEFRVSGQVAFRNQGLIGVAFREIRSGQANFLRLIQRLSLKAFGISGIRGRW